MRRRFAAARLPANRGHLCFLVFDGSLNAEVFIRFCRRLLRQRRRRVFLIVEGHPVHRSAAVHDWLRANRRRLHLFFLPGYSPELNPDEYLNNDVKTNAVGRQRPATKDELILNLEQYLRDIQCRPNIIRNYIQPEPVPYAAGQACSMFTASMIESASFLQHPAPQQGFFYPAQQSSHAFYSRSLPASMPLNPWARLGPSGSSRYGRSFGLPGRVDGSSFRASGSIQFNGLLRRAA